MDKWKTLVVGLEASVRRHDGKVSDKAQRMKETILLVSANEMAAEGSLYTVVTRADLESKGGKDPKSLANSLKQLLKQDRIKGLAKKQKVEANKQQAASQQQHQQQPVDVVFDDAKSAGRSSEFDDANSQSIRGAEEEILKKKVDEESLRVQRLEEKIEEYMAVDSTIRFAPSQQEMEVGRAILSIGKEEAKPDKIYLLSDYPSTVEEASYLLGSGTTQDDAALDVIVELIGGITDAPYSTESRTASRVSEGAKTLAPSSSFSSLVINDNTKSMPNLPDGVDALFPSELEASDSGLLLSREAMEEGMAKPFAQGTFFTSNNIVAAFKNAQANANGPGWKDLVFLDLPIAPKTEQEDADKYLPLNVMKSFNKLVQGSALEKYRFAKYLQQCPRVKIGKNVRDPAIERELMDLYTSLVNKDFHTEGLRSVATTLGCMVEAVELHGEKIGEETQPESCGPETESAGNHKTVPKKVNLSPIVEVGDETMIRGAHAFESVQFMGKQQEQNVLMMSIAAEKQRAATLSRFVGFERRYWGQVKVPGGIGRFGMPRWPKLSTTDRGITRTQFRAFHSFSPERLEYIRCLEKFEEMFKEVCPSMSTWDFSGRQYLRKLGPAVLSQVLGNAICEEPQITTAYLPQSDLLLVGLYREIPTGRRCQIVRTAFKHTNLRPTFSEWPSLDLRKQQSIFDVETGPIKNVEEHVEMIYPCDNGLIRLEKVPALEKSWCSVYKDGHTFGLRKNGMYAAFSDGATVQVCRGPEAPGKPDKLGTMKSTYTSVDGLTVSHCSDGRIRMSSCSLSKIERERVILGSGAVVRFLADDETSEILFPNGDFMSLNRTTNESTRHTFQDGGMTFKEALVNGEEGEDGKKLDKKASTKKNLMGLKLVSSQVSATVETFIDPETDALVQFRPVDNVTLITHTDGTRLVIHRDGTRILMEDQSQVRVEAKNFATVKINLETEATAATHSQGGRVDISRGGRNIRSSTLMPDATVVLIEYDTRVTAKVNGMINILKPDGTALETSDDGLVIWRPWNVDAQQRAHREATIKKEEEQKLPHDAREQPDRNIGCYLFQCDTFELKLVDWEYNVYHISNVTDFKSCTANVDLSGAFGPVEAVINSPWSPRLFVLSGDGNGFEYLAELQVKQTYERMSKEFRGEFQKNALDSFQYIPIATPLEQLYRSSAYLVPVLDQIKAASRFESSSTKRKPAQHSSIRPKWLLVDNIVKQERVSKKERTDLANADFEYAQWQKEVAAMENRFNVDDNRCEDDIEEEKKLQQMIHKERKKHRKLEKKRNRKHSTASNSTTASSVISCQSSSKIPPDFERATFCPSPIDEGSGDDEEDQFDFPREEDEEGGESHNIHNENTQSPTAKERPQCPESRNLPMGNGINFWNQ